MTAPTIEIPARKWADDELAPEPTPTVLVSSRDGVTPPAARGVGQLVAAAEAAGWTARVTYALAEIPDHHYLNGKLKKAAHRLASVVVRLHRGGARVWAAWHNAAETGWRFVCAFAGTERLTLRRGKRKADSDAPVPRLISEVLT